MARRRTPAGLCPRPGAVRFFQANAGYARSQFQRADRARLRNARELAIAECLFEKRGGEVRWEPDQDAEREPGEDGEAFCAVAEINGHRTSLCGIIGPDRTFARLVEAELAEELLHEDVGAASMKLARRRGRPFPLEGAKRKKRSR